MNLPVRQAMAAVLVPIAMSMLVAYPRQTAGKRETWHDQAGGRPQLGKVWAVYQSSESRRTTHPMPFWVIGQAGHIRSSFSAEALPSQTAFAAKTLPDYKTAIQAGSL